MMWFFFIFWQMMTLPGYRVTGRYFEQIDEFASPRDESLIQRAYLDQVADLKPDVLLYTGRPNFCWLIG